MSITENMAHAAERQAASVIIDQLLKKLNKANDYEERSEIYLKIVDMAEKFYNDGDAKEKLDAVRKYVSDPNNRWMKVINSIIDDTDPGYAKNDYTSSGTKFDSDTIDYSMSTAYIIEYN